MPADAPASTLGLVACIAEAQAAFGTLPRDQHAQIRSDKANYEYDYISEAALMARTREVLSPMGVAVLTSCEKVDPSAGGVWITVRVSFHKGDESLSVTGMAQGLDRADKAYNKAITTATRIILGKLFLQGGDIDPEQTVNERPAPGPAKLSDSQLKRLTQKALDSKITTPDGAIDPKLLLRIASYVAGTQITRLDEIPAPVFAKLVEGLNGKPPALDGYAANPELGLQRVEEKEAENGW